MNILEDNQYSSNFTRIQKITNSLKSEEINIKNSIFAEGTISNLNDPIDDQDAATFNYVLNNSGGALAAQPLNSVQYNLNNTEFGGSSDLLFNNNILTAKLLTNQSSVNIGNGTIKNLGAPTTGSQAATKIYSQKTLNIKNTQNNTLSSIQYEADDMVNGIIDRNITGVGISITDTFPTALEIIGIVGNSINSTYNFIIRNVSTDFSSVIRITQASINTGITLNGSDTNIYPGYQYTSIIKVTSSTTVEIILLNCNVILVNENFNYEFAKTVLNVNILQCKDYFLEWIDSYSITNPFASNQGFIVVSGYGMSQFGRVILLKDIFEQKSLIIGNCTGTNSNTSDTTNNRLVLEQFPTDNRTYDFYIVNPSTNTAAVVFDDTKPEFNVVLDSVNNIYSIDPGQTGWFYLTSNDANSGALYTLGIFDTYAP